MPSRPTSRASPAASRPPRTRAALNQVVGAERAEPHGGGTHPRRRAVMLIRRSALDEVRAAALAAREPAARDRLLAREELHGVRPVGVQVAEEGVLPAAEREERDRRRHADV